MATKKKTKVKKKVKATKKTVKSIDQIYDEFDEWWEFWKNTFSSLELSNVEVAKRAWVAAHQPKGV